MPLFEINNLAIKSGQKTIVSPISFSINEGDFVAITGPSGSGKSTILKYLAQLNDPSLTIEGEYLYQGQLIDQINPIELRKEVSYCFQTAHLFGETVRDNLSFPYDIRHQQFEEDKALELLNKVQLPSDFLDKKINTLSGGEKQRVALIRNLMLEPNVLLLDEVTSALDTDTRTIIWKWLESYRIENDMTIIMVSHHEHEQDQADRKITLSASSQSSEDDLKGNSENVGQVEENK